MGTRALGGKGGMLMGSILNEIKKPLGLEADYTAFDTDIIMFINTAISTLTQIGVGSSAGFSIKDAADDWPDFIGDATDLEDVKTYIYLKVRLVFDPPAVAAVLEAFNKTVSELEFRINMKVDSAPIVTPV